VFVTLRDRHGRYVASCSTPDIAPMPEILIWGERHFLRDGTWGQYREAMALKIEPKATATYADGWGGEQGLEGGH
jgi:hypothetical protein